MRTLSKEIEMYDDLDQASNRTGLAPSIVEVTDTALDHGSEVRRTVIIDEGDDDDDNYLSARNSLAEGRNEPRGGDLFDSSLERRHWPSEEDTELAHAVSLSLKTAELEKALRKQVNASEPGDDKEAEVQEPWKFAPSNGRQGIGFNGRGSSSHSKLEAQSSSTHDTVEGLEKKKLRLSHHQVLDNTPLVLHPTMKMSFHQSGDAYLLKSKMKQSCLKLQCLVEYLKEVDILLMHRILSCDLLLRELAIQIGEQFGALGSTVGVKCAVIFIYGEVGPLHSDVTLGGVAKAFGVRLAPDEEFEEYLRHLIGDHCTE